MYENDLLVSRVKWDSYEIQNERKSIGSNEILKRESIEVSNGDKYLARKNHYDWSERDLDFKAN